MIEMHQDGEPLGDDDEYADYDLRLPRRPGLFQTVFSAGSLAIASFGIAVADLTILRVADGLGVTRLESANQRHVSSLSQIRVSDFAQLVVAVLALMIAIAAIMRLNGEPDPDDELAPPEDPLWVRAIGGAGFLVSAVCVVLTAIGLAYALHVHGTPIDAPFN